MKKSTKAVLFSALVFPGAGHFVVKKTAIGLALTCIAVIALVMIIANPVQAGMALLEKKMDGGVLIPDPQMITELVEVIRSELWRLNAAWIALIASWVVGIVDSYRIGRMQDQA